LPKAVLLNVGGNAPAIKITELKAVVSSDNNVLKGHVVYDPFGNTVLIFQKFLEEVARQTL
jgi:hypothetical protein